MSNWARLLANAAEEASILSRSEAVKSNAQEQSGEEKDNAEPPRNELKAWWSNANNLHLPEEDEPQPTQLPLTRILPLDAPRLTWRKRPSREKVTLHWGQRKLLLQEMEFLTQFSASGDTVLYIGAAPGRHVGYLAGCFPELEFILLDPEMFRCPERPNIRVIQSMFTDAWAAEFAKMHRSTPPDGERSSSSSAASSSSSPPSSPSSSSAASAVAELPQERKMNQLLFLSDIRTGDFRRMDPEENEGRIAQDQLDQWRWLTILRPKASLLKFRLPYTEGQTTYLQGKLYLPVWGRQSTTECRLLVTETDHYSRGISADDSAVPEWSGDWRTQLWDHQTYWEQMFWFNCRTRIQRYPHPLRGVEGLGHCYDCTSEVLILRDFLLQRRCRRRRPPTGNGSNGGAPPEQEMQGNDHFEMIDDEEKEKERDDDAWKRGLDGGLLPRELLLDVPLELRAEVRRMIAEISASLSMSRTLANNIKYWQNHHNHEAQVSMPLLKAQLQPWAGREKKKRKRKGKKKRPQKSERARKRRRQQEESDSLPPAARRE